MPVNRHPALANLSRDHQLFLIEARRVRWLIENDERAGTLTEVVESLLHFWKTSGEAHLKEEETILFPAYLEANPLARREVDALITDHNWLRDKLRELGDLPRYENTNPVLISLAEYIVNHIRLEENEIYDKIQNTLNSNQLEELALAAARFRLEERGTETHFEISEDIESLLG